MKKQKKIKTIRTFYIKIQNNKARQRLYQINQQTGLSMEIKSYKICFK